MEIYITNLKYSTDRRLHMEKQMKATGLPYRFFDCVIGADLSSEELEKKCNMPAIEKQNEKIRWFTRGIIGCTLTNQLIYQDIINRNLDYALFMEDDTLVPQNLAAILANAETWLRQGDVVLLFWNAWAPLQLTEPVVRTNLNIEYYFPENYQALTGGSGYIVTREAAKKMIETNTPVHTTPDNWKFYYDNKSITRLLCVYPHVIQTADFKSTMKTGSFHQIRELINRYRIFPLYQILKYRRNKLKRKSHKAVFVTPGVKR